MRHAAFIAVRNVPERTVSKRHKITEQQIQSVSCASGDSLAAFCDRAISVGASKLKYRQSKVKNSLPRRLKL
jgi:hypothetical protein